MTVARVVPNGVSQTGLKSPALSRLLPQSQDGPDVALNDIQQRRCATLSSDAGRGHAAPPVPAGRHQGGRPPLAALHRIRLLRPSRKTGDLTATDTTLVGLPCVAEVMLVWLGFQLSRAAYSAWICFSVASFFQRVTSLWTRAESSRVCQAPDRSPWCQGAP